MDEKCGERAIARDATQRSEEDARIDDALRINGARSGAAVPVFATPACAARSLRGKS
jgi:hypothetical protein